MKLEMTIFEKIERLTWNHMSLFRISLSAFE